MVLFIASTTSLLLGITVGGTLYPWTSFRTLLPTIFGVAGLILFCLVEHYVKQPMIPLKVFKSRTSVSAYLGTFVHGLVRLVVDCF